MTNKKYHTDGTVPKSRIEIVERDTIKTLTLKYIAADIPGLVRVLL